MLLARSKRQDKNNPAYANCKVEESPIGRALGISGRTSALRRVALNPGGEVTGTERGTGSGGSSGAAGTGISWTLRLVLHNPGNQCYANASILALCHACLLARTTPPPLRQMLEKLRSQAQFGLRTTLSTTLQQIRQISGPWAYNGEQQDASEYMAVVLDSAGAFSQVWCSRFEEDGIVADTDHGKAILLEMTTRGADLQALIDEWQHQAHVHALSLQHPVVPVQIGRHSGGRKNQARLSFAEDVALPVFSNATCCLRTIYRPVAAVVHLGHECRSGHYRSILRWGSQWFYTGDGCRAVSCGMASEHLCNVCYIWLARPSLLPDTGNNRC